MSLNEPGSVTIWAHLPWLGLYQFYGTPWRAEVGAGTSADRQPGAVTGERLALTRPGR